MAAENSATSAASCSCRSSTCQRPHSHWEACSPCFSVRSQWWYTHLYGFIAFVWILIRVQCKDLTLDMCARTELHSWYTMSILDLIITTDPLHSIIKGHPVLWFKHHNVTGFHPDPAVCSCGSCQTSQIVSVDACQTQSLVTQPETHSDSVLPV